MSTVSIHAAQSEFEARAVYAFLLEQGIPTVVQSNEMPQEPGFRFGSGPWGYLLADVSQAEEAAALAREYSEVLLGDMPERQRMPLQFNVRTSWTIAICLLLWIPIVMLQSLLAEIATDHPYALFMSWAIYVMGIFALLTPLVAANPSLGRAMLNALKMLPMLLLAPVALLWLLIESIDGLLPRSGSKPTPGA